MTVRSHRVLPLALLAALAACSHGTPPVAPSAVPAPVNPIDRAVELLDQGDEDGARKVLKPLLKQTPGDPEANVLIASMDQDPVALLGPKSFAYKTEPGDTMLGLSQKFLGNRLKFYELARYNGLKLPVQLAPGTALKIPGEPPRPPASAEPAPVRAPAVRPAPRKAKPAAPAGPAPAAPHVPAADPAAAMRLRGAALAALNQGKADQAVAMLRRAATLAPGNPLITRDLARAERIAETVRAHR